MSSPNYTLWIDTIIVLHKAKRNVRLRRKSTITFVPREGMKFRFENDDNDTQDIEFVNVVYLNNEGVFYEEHEDTSLIDELRESDGPECTITPARLEEHINYYKSFGWELA